jgi:hypothetical protein
MYTRISKQDQYETQRFIITNVARTLKTLQQKVSSEDGFAIPSNNINNPDEREDDIGIRAIFDEQLLLAVNPFWPIGEEYKDGEEKQMWCNENEEDEEGQYAKMKPISRPFSRRKKNGLYQQHRDENRNNFEGSDDGRRKKREPEKGTGKLLRGTVAEQPEREDERPGGAVEV